MEPNVKAQQSTNKRFFFQNFTEATKHLYQRQRNKVKSMVRDSLSKYYKKQK